MPLAVAVFLLLQGVEPLVKAGRIALRQHLNERQLAMAIDAVEYLPDTYTPTPAGRYPTGIEAYRGPLVQGPAQRMPGARLAIRATRDGRVTLRTANFPRWRVEGPAGAVPILPGPLVSFEARAGGTYRLTAAPTRPELIGGALSLIGLLMAAALWFWRAPTRRA